MSLKITGDTVGTGTVKSVVVSINALNCVRMMSGQYMVSVRKMARRFEDSVKTVFG